MNLFDLIQSCSDVEERVRHSVKSLLGMICSTDPIDVSKFKGALDECLTIIHEHSEMAAYIASVEHSSPMLCGGMSIGESKDMLSGADAHIYLLNTLMGHMAERLGEPSVAECNEAVESLVLSIDEKRSDLMRDIDESSRRVETTWYEDGDDSDFALNVPFTSKAVVDAKGGIGAFVIVDADCEFCSSMNRRESEAFWIRHRDIMSVLERSVNSGWVQRETSPVTARLHFDDHFRFEDHGI